MWNLLFVHETRVHEPECSIRNPFYNRCAATRSAHVADAKLKMCIGYDVVSMRGHHVMCQELVVSHYISAAHYSEI